MVTVTLPKLAFDVMAEHARAAYPEECCGLVTSKTTTPLALTAAFPCANLQNKYHALDPEEFPRDATNAYLLDPRELAKLEEKAEAVGERVAGNFHSHPEVGAYFSAEDKKVALMGGDEPAFGDFLHLVIDARKGEGGAVVVPVAKAFVWDASAKDFVEAKLEVGV